MGEENGRELSSQSRDSNRSLTQKERVSLFIPVIHLRRCDSAIRLRSPQHHQARVQLSRGQDQKQRCQTSTTFPSAISVPSSAGYNVSHRMQSRFLTASYLQIQSPEGCCVQSIDGRPRWTHGGQDTSKPGRVPRAQDRASRRSKGIWTSFGGASRSAGATSPSKTWQGDMN